MIDQVEQDRVAEFGTGLLRTTVTATAAGKFVWRRSPGPLAPAPFVPGSDELHAAVRAVGSRGGVRPVLGVPEAEDRVYRVRGGESVAATLLRDGPRPEHEQVLRGLGQVLRAMHDTPPPESLPAPRGLARLGDWLTARAASPRAAAAAATLRRLLGKQRWDTLVRWYTEMAADEVRVLAHGAAGLGGVIAGQGDESATADLLVGEDLCAAPWYFDLCWALGDLVELKWSLGGDVERWQGLTEALFAGYGNDLGVEWNRLATIRIAMHLHDFVAYVGWPEDEFASYATFLRFLIDL